MADILNSSFGQITKRFKDMGDSTFAEVVSTSSGTGTAASQAQGNIASGATDSGNPVKIGGVYNSALPTFTTGQRGDFQIGSRGGVHVNLYTPDSSLPIAVTSAPADGASNASVGYIFHVRGQVFNGSTWDRARGDTTGAYVVEQASAVGGYSFSNLKANATTTVKSGAGKLHSISINTKGITNTVTVYDNTAGSGTTIATIDSTLGQASFMFDLAFATGLTIVIAGGTAADITVTYK